jgi:Fe-S cluster biogenesis protein NfuA
LEDDVRQNLVERVEEALDLIRPALQRDGGDVRLVEIGDDMIARMVMTGHCSGCPMAQMTLKMGIERVVRQNVPEIVGVEALPPDSVQEG